MTSQPLRTVLQSPSQSGRLEKWAIELSEYDIEYKPPTSSKSQVLADFVIELAPKEDNARSNTQTRNYTSMGPRRDKGSGSEYNSRISTAKPTVSSMSDHPLASHPSGLGGPRPQQLSPKRPIMKLTAKCMKPSEKNSRPDQTGDSQYLTI